MHIPWVQCLQPASASTEDCCGLYSRSFELELRYQHKLYFFSFDTHQLQIYRHTYICYYDHTRTYCM